jgi:hypothetical protein
MTSTLSVDAVHATSIRPLPTAVAVALLGGVGGVVSEPPAIGVAMSLWTSA